MSNRWQMYDSMRDMTEKYNNTVDQVDYALEVLREATTGGCIISVPEVIPVSAWIPNSTINGYSADINCEESNSNLIPMVAIHPDCMDTAGQCEMLSTVQTLNGTVRFFAKNRPLNDISVQITLLLPRDFLSDITVEKPSGSDYDLPVATPYRLGGVKIGKNMSITADGVLSMDESNVLNALIASPGDVNNMIEDVFGDSSENS